MSEVTITIEQDGDLTFLDTESAQSFKELGTVRTRRASHVEPASSDTRFWFHTLRALFGETGRVADWTRNWKCLWRVNTSPVCGPIIRYKHLNDYTSKAMTRWGRGDCIVIFSNRQNVIDVEVNFLDNFFMEKK